MCSENDNLDKYGSIIYTMDWCFYRNFTSVISSKGLYKPFDEECFASLIVGLIRLLVYVKFYEDGKYGSTYDDLAKAEINDDEEVMKMTNEIFTSNIDCILDKLCWNYIYQYYLLSINNFMPINTLAESYATLARRSGKLNPLIKINKLRGKNKTFYYIARRMIIYALPKLFKYCATIVGLNDEIMGRIMIYDQLENRYMLSVYPKLFPDADHADARGLTCPFRVIDHSNDKEDIIHLYNINIGTNEIYLSLLNDIMVYPTDSIFLCSVCNMLIHELYHIYQCELGEYKGNFDKFLEAAKNPHELEFDAYETGNQIYLDNENDIRAMVQPMCDTFRLLVYNESIVFDK
jgi:hypothetical protein